MIDVYARRAPPPKGRARVVVLRSMLPLVAKDAAKTWVHFTIDGEYEGHPAGAFSFDPEVHGQILANFERQANPIPLTYEHPKYDDGQPKPAAGWVHSLELRTDGLWGLCEFTARAAEMIRAGEYRFTSVVVSFDSTDRKSGEPCGAEMFEVALTNTPFIDGQEPIRLSRRAGAARGFEMAIDRKKLMEALDQLPKDASVDDYHKALDAVALMEDALAGGSDAPDASPDATPAPMAAPAPEAELAVAPPVTVGATPAAELADPAQSPPPSAAAADALALLMTATGLDEAGVLAFLNDHQDDLKKLAGGQPASGTAADANGAPGSAMSIEKEGVALSAATARIRAAEAQLKARDAEIVALKAEADKAKAGEVEARVGRAIELGHVLDKDRDKFVKLGKTSPELLAEWLGEAATSPAVPTGVIAAKTDAAATTETMDLSKFPADEVAALTANLKAAKIPEKDIPAALERHFRRVTRAGNRRI